MALNVQPADTYWQAISGACDDGDLAEVANLCRSAVANLDPGQLAALLYASALAMHEVAAAWIEEVKGKEDQDRIL